MKEILIFGGRLESTLSKIKGIRFRTEQFKYSFFPFCINEWNKLDNMIKSL